MFSVEARSVTFRGQGTTVGGAANEGRCWTVDPSERRMAGGRMLFITHTPLFFLIGHRNLLGAGDEQLSGRFDDDHSGQEFCHLRSRIGCR